MNQTIILTGIVCITIIEIVALLKGFNGIMLTAAIGIIAGAIGVIAPQPKMFRQP